MAAGQGSDTYITIRDFSNGIASSRHALTGAQPALEDQQNAAVFAQETDTWGCYGHPSGGLHPLPGLIQQIEDPGDDWPDDPLPGAAAPVAGKSAHPNYTSEKSLVVNATALIQASPTFGVGSSASGRDGVHTTPDQLHVLYGGYGVADGNSTSEWFQGTNEWRVFNMSLNPVDPIALMGGHLAADDAIDSLGVRRSITNYSLEEAGFSDDDIWGDHFMSLGMSFANLVVATSGVYESTGGAVEADGAVTDIGRTAVVALTTRVGIFPRIIGKNLGGAADTDTDAIETFIIDESSPLGPKPGSPIRQGIVHQGRVVFTVYSANGVATAQDMGASAFFQPGDNMCFYAANDLYNDPTTNVYRFMPENPGTIGVMASMNANELIAIKHNGGGGLLRGDVANPQFVALPGLPSIQGATNVPTVTQMGLVFGTAEGVYLWQGSEGADLISPTLEGWFWKPQGTPDINDGYLYNEYPVRGKFNVSPPFLYAPNNWVFDMRSNGWFRLAPTTQDLTVEETTTTYNTGYRNYEVSVTGRVYGIKPLITESDLIVGHIYDKAVPAHQFSWRSQPIARTMARRVDVREIVLTAQGAGTVTVTVLGSDGQQDSVAFTVDSPDRPKVFTKPINVQTEDIEVKIESVGGSTATYTDDGAPYALDGYPAPSVYRVSLGAGQGPSVKRQGTLTRTPAS